MAHAVGAPRVILDAWPRSGRLAAVAVVLVFGGVRLERVGVTRRARPPRRSTITSGQSTTDVRRFAVRDSNPLRRAHDRGVSHSATWCPWQRLRASGGFSQPSTEHVAGCVHCRPPTPSSAGSRSSRGGRWASRGLTCASRSACSTASGPLAAVPGVRRLYVKLRLRVGLGADALRTHLTLLGHARGPARLPCRVVLLALAHVRPCSCPSRWYRRNRARATDSRRLPAHNVRDVTCGVRRLTGCRP